MNINLFFIIFNIIYGFINKDWISIIIVISEFIICNKKFILHIIKHIFNKLFTNNTLN